LVVGKLLLARRIALGRRCLLQPLRLRGLRLLLRLLLARKRLLAFCGARGAAAYRLRALRLGRRLKH
jgi:hypothetical protein